MEVVLTRLPIPSPSAQTTSVRFPSELSSELFSLARDSLISNPDCEVKRMLCFLLPKFPLDYVFHHILKSDKSIFDSIPSFENPKRRYQGGQFTSRLNENLKALLLRIKIVQLFPYFPQ